MRAKVMKSSKPMRTIIHIGQHKTGTTSIQKFLQQKKVELSKNGVYVPDSIAGYKHRSHFILNVYALNENRFSSMKEKLLKTKTKEYFSGLHQELESDISKHYSLAEKQGCRDIIWTNEGLYLLNSQQEYSRLRKLFDKYSSEVICVCCFREVESYKKSYAKQLMKQNINLSVDKDSYRYLQADSWLFDYPRKIRILEEVFDRVIAFPYNPLDNVSAFLERIGYPENNIESIRLNVTKHT